MSSKNKGLNKSNIIWRYLDLPKFMSFMQNSSLFLTRSDKFGDKFEGQFTHSIKTLIERSYKENNIDFTYEKFKIGLRKGVFVNCWHLGAKENMAMWQIYGKSSYAVALRTTVGRLEKQIKPHNMHNNISIRKVEYIDHFEDPEIDVSKYTNIFSYKHDAYSFEKEVRVIADHYPNPEVMAIDSNGFEIDININELLSEIIISPEAPEWFYKVVKNVCSQYKCENLVKTSDLTNDPI